MKNTFILLLFIFGFTFSLGQDGIPYQIYKKNKTKVSFKRMAKDLTKYDIVLFGEHHDNSINHWLQLELTKALYQTKNENLILGAEMFERDNQSQLNQYLAGEIDPKNLKDSIRLWNNHFTDYQPLVNFAKSNQLEFIATNIPRRYASIVAKNGLDSLNTVHSNEKEFMMKLPVEVDMKTPGYKEMLDLLADHAGPLVQNFVAAQAVKDATMAESIYNNFKNGQLFLHYQGNYHSKEYGGIYWYLKKLNPNLKIAVISVFITDDPKLKLPKEDLVPTEFNLVIPEEMTKTY